MKPIRILLVDDDEDDFILTKDLFSEIPQSENYKLTWCNNFEEAINAMLKSHYDVYLVDYRLGKYTGIDLLHEAIKSNVAEPIIILTGKGDFKVDEEALRTGAADYLIKDKIDPFSLERSIRYALQHTRTLEQLKESENKFRIIFERSLDPILITDFAGNIYDINKAGAKFFGLSHLEMLKTNARQLYRNIADRVSFTQQMEEKGAVYDFEVELMAANNQPRYCSLSAFLQISQHGNSELYHVVVHDLTFRKQVEQQSVSSEKLAVSERIAKSLANEIRNPLSNVNLAIDELVAELKDRNDGTRLYLDIIKKNCERINHLTSEFIASTQPGALTFMRTDLNDILRNILDKAEDAFELNNIIVSKDIGEEQVFADVDEEKLKLAVNNILNNAIEAMDGYGNRLAIKTVSAINSYTIQIQDNGKGIAPENISKIFEPFFSTKIKADGLGLTNAQNIIAAHGGKITFQSRPGQGTTFNIQIPLKSGGLN
ncbi:MAG TPA: ATP-binding protein [Sphingobacteriaceae bacterium]